MNKKQDPVEYIVELQKEVREWKAKYWKVVGGMFFFIIVLGVSIKFLGWCR